MRILVTGANGFIGSALLRALVARHPTAEIVVLGRQGRAPLALIPGVRTVVIDYLDTASLCACEALERVDCVYHVAGVKNGLDRRDFWEGNVLPTRHLLEALASKGGAGRFVFASSQAAAGPSLNRSHYRCENEPERPIEWYGRSKAAAEDEVRASSIPWTIVRPSAVYGPGDRDFLVIYRMAQRGLAFFPGNRWQYLSIIEVGDLVSAVIGAAESDSCLGQTLFACNDEPTSWDEVYREVFEASGTSLRSLELPLALVAAACHLGDVVGRVRGSATLWNSQKVQLSVPRYWIASNAKLKQLTSFSPKLSLHDGLCRTRAWYQETGWLR